MALERFFFTLLSIRPNRTPISLSLLTLTGFCLSTAGTYAHKWLSGSIKSKKETASSRPAGQSASPASKKKELWEFSSRLGEIMFS